MNEDPMSTKKKSRVLVLGQDVDQDSATEIIKSIYEYNLIDEENEALYAEYERKPIHLLINTFGGSVYDGLGIIGAIELSGTPVVGTLMGSAMSMGLFILASCHHRRAHAYSTLMYHQISSGIWDKLEGIRKDLEEAERLQELCDGILFRKTKLKQSDLESHKTKKSEWYITPKNAMDLGIIDEIFGTQVTEEKKKKGKKEEPAKPAKAPLKAPRKRSEK